MGFDYNSISQATNLLNVFNPGKHEIITVNSLQQAKDFHLNRGDSYLLLDPNADILYIKECDSIGKLSLRIFKLTDVTESYEAESTPVSISKLEYDNLIQTINKLANRVDNGVKNATEKQPEQPELDISD